MPITFNCENCRKKIKAPDNGGGKYGKCPNCNHRCYIPTPKSPDEEELKLVPINENEESRYEEMMTETSTLTEKILHETDALEEANAEAPNDRTLEKNIILYLRQMADGLLDDAQKTSERFARFKPQTIKVLNQIVSNDTPEPELADVPEKILTGLTKNLRTRLS